MRALSGVLFAAAVVFVPEIASAARPTVTGDPCAGCVTSWSPGDEPAPLLVVLHGDWGMNAAALHAAWEPLVASRGISLLALACPKDEGCKDGSFWRWNGPPAWIDRMVASVSTSHREVDRSRLWIAGWSGGATYLGYRTVELEQRFAALVFHGGGAAPYGSACASPSSPTYFLVGDKNPLHNLTVELRDHYRTCGNELTWNVLPGADHDKEWQALAKTGPAIVDWLVAHPRAASATVDAGGDVVVPPRDAGAPEAATAPTTPDRSTRLPSPPTGCGCTILGHGAPRGGFTVGVLGAILALARRSARRFGRGERRDDDR